MKKTITYKEIKAKVLDIINNGGGGGGGSSTVKSFSYVGNGDSTKSTITFPTRPTLILQITGEGEGGNWINSGVIPFVDGDGVHTNTFANGRFVSHGGQVGMRYTIEGNTIEMRRDGDSGACFNSNGKEYTVFYI